MDVLSGKRSWADHLFQQYEDLDFRFRRFEDKFRSPADSERQWVKRIYTSLSLNDEQSPSETFNTQYLSVVSSWGLLIVGCAILLKVSCSEFFSYRQRVKDETEYSTISIGEFLQYR